MFNFQAVPKLYYNTETTGPPHKHKQKKSVCVKEFEAHEKGKRFK